MNQDGLLSAALGYARLGWRMVPLIQREKKSWLRDWVNAASCDAGTIQGWWERKPGSNVGVLLGTNLVAVDVDSDEGEALLMTLSGGDLPLTLQHATSKGRRLLYRIPDGLAVMPQNVPFKNADGKTEALALMGVGHQVVLPPSIHPSGSTYTWAPECSPEDRDAAPMPDWMIAHMCVAEDKDDRSRRFGGEHPKAWDPFPREDYDRRCGRRFLDVLLADGWQVHSRGGGHAKLTRPGKSVREGNSATLGFKDDDETGCPMLYVFSTSVEHLKPNRFYTLSGYVNATRHEGDWKRTHAALRDDGYGKPREGQTLSWTYGNPPPSAPPSTPSAARPAYLPPPPYRPFPVDVLPDPWDHFVREGSAALRCDPALVALPLLAVLAGAVGTSRRIHLGGEWCEPSVLWCCTIAESGTLKSPAAELSVNLVQERQWDLSRVYAEEQTAYEAVRDVDDHAAEPVLKRVLVGDTTVEALANILNDNPRGLLLHRDELAGWLVSFTRYRGTRGSDEPAWLSMHRAGMLIVDRKSEKVTVVVPHAAVSVCGSIQPGVLAKYLTADMIESGFASRIVFGMPPRQPKRYVEGGVREATKTAARTSLGNLHDLKFDVVDGVERPAVLGLTDEAKVLWQDFVDRWGERSYTSDGATAAALSKLEALPGRFALIHHLVLTTQGVDAERDVPDQPVGAASIAAGIRFTEWCANEAERVYAMLSESTADREVHALVELVGRIAERHRSGVVTVRALQKANSRKYRTRAAAEADLERLVALGLGEWVQPPDERRGGWKPRAFLPRTPGTPADVRDDDDGPLHDTSDTRPTPRDPTAEQAGVGSVVPGLGVYGGVLPGSSVGSVVKRSGGAGLKPDPGPPHDTSDTDRDSPENESSVGSVVQGAEPGCGQSDATLPIVVQTQVGADPVVVPESGPPARGGPDPALPTEWCGTRPNGRPDPGGDLSPGQPLPPHATFWRQRGTEWTPVDCPDRCGHQVDRERRTGPSMSTRCPQPDLFGPVTDVGD